MFHFVQIIGRWCCLLHVELQLHIGSSTTFMLRRKLFRRQCSGVIWIDWRGVVIFWSMEADSAEEKKISIIIWYSSIKIVRYNLKVYIKMNKWWISKLLKMSSISIVLPLHSSQTFQEKSSLVSSLQVM